MKSSKKVQTTPSAFIFEVWYGFSGVSIYTGAGKRFTDHDTTRRVRLVMQWVRETTGPATRRDHEKQLK